MHPNSQQLINLIQHFSMCCLERCLHESRLSLELRNQLICGLRMLVMLELHSQVFNLALALFLTHVVVSDLVVRKAPLIVHSPNIGFYCLY